MKRKMKIKLKGREEETKMINSFEVLVKSVVPEVYGLNTIKESILLQLFGENINILIVGDPGIAKTTILEYISKIKRNNHVVCIDNLHRLSNNEKEELLSKMEHGKISVLASANPKLGRFDPYAPIPEQVEISSYLLACFDLIFIVRDIPNKRQDEVVASFILEERDKLKQDIRDNPIVERLGKAGTNPKLTKEAINKIKEFYIKIRNPPIEKDSDIIPVTITARQLSSIVKLTKAHAKIRLSAQVTEEDVTKVLEILKQSLCQIGCMDE
jgi:replicative DNA helicase Mcm